MATLRALVVGVSDYTAMRQNNLPFCVNDIQAISEAFISGLKVDPSNIITCGNTGVVLSSDFIAALKRLSSIVETDDTLLFYFSGHGGTLPQGHHLLLSDSYINTQDIISYLEAIPTKNKVIFIDSCMSGNFSVNQSAVFDINSTVNEFEGKGYAVFASSNATQYSFGHPDKPVSLYTSFLCESIKDIHLIREGKKSLYDIEKLLFLYLEIWNKNNPDKQQNPIFRANMGGTIFFDIQEFHAFYVEKIYEETDRYIIYSVEPLHNGIAKRYAVKVILKMPFSFEEISIINLEIVEKVKKVDVYKNEISERHWRGKNANLVFCYFGRDETDMIDCNYLCHTTWADQNQDKNWWYRLDKNSEVLNDVHFNYHSYYESLKIFTQEHTGDKDKLIADTKVIISNLITLAEKVIAMYNEFLHVANDENTLVGNLSSCIQAIDKYYFAETDLDIPPQELKEWSQCCSNLSATIHDFTLFYNAKYLSGRTPENRIACMNLTIKRYYEDLEKLKKIERTI
jgi:Caspase domain.